MLTSPANWKFAAKNRWRNNASIAVTPTGGPCWSFLFCHRFAPRSPESRPMVVFKEPGGANSFRRHEPLPRAAKRQLDAEGRGQEDVNFAAFYFLQIAGCDFRLLRQRVLSHSFADALAPDVRPKSANSHPFFFGNRHAPLRRVSLAFMNDTYIVKIFPNPACFRESAKANHVLIQ